MTIRNDCFAKRLRSCLLLDGVVILALLATPVDWVKLKEPHSAALAAGGADAGASSGLEGHWLNWDEVCRGTELWRGSDGFLVILAEGDDCPSWLWSRWVRLRRNWGQDEEVGWSSLSKGKRSSGGFLGEGEEG